MMTTTRAASLFAAPAVGWLLHRSPPPAIVVARRTLSCDCRRSLSSPAAFAVPLPLRSLVGTCIVDRRPISSSSLANVRYSIPSSPRCPHMLSLPAAARLCHSSWWLIGPKGLHHHAMNPVTANDDDDNDDTPLPPPPENDYLHKYLHII